MKKVICLGAANWIERGSFITAVFVYCFNAHPLTGQEV